MAFVHVNYWVIKIHIESIIKTENDKKNKKLKEIKKLKEVSNKK